MQHVMLLVGMQFACAACIPTTKRVLLMGWFGSTPRALKHVGDLYAKAGYSATLFPCPPSDMLQSCWYPSWKRWQAEGPPAEITADGPFDRVHLFSGATFRYHNWMINDPHAFGHTEVVYDSSPFLPTPGQVRLSGWLSVTCLLFLCYPLPANPPVLHICWPGAGSGLLGAKVTAHHCHALQVRSFMCGLPGKKLQAALSLPGAHGVVEAAINTAWRLTGYKHADRLPEYLNTMDCGRKKILLLGAEDPMVDHGLIDAQVTRWRSFGTDVVVYKFAGLGHVQARRNVVYGTDHSERCRTNTTQHAIRTDAPRTCQSERAIRADAPCTTGAPQAPGGVPRGSGRGSGGRARGGKGPALRTGDERA